MSPQSLLFIPSEHLRRAFSARSPSPHGEVIERKGGLIAATVALAFAVAAGLGCF